MKNLKKKLTNPDDLETFQKLANRKARTKGLKQQRQTEALLESLADQNRSLSSANLMLRKMFKAAMRALPEDTRKSLEREFREMSAAIEATDSESGFDVHP